MSCGSDTYYLVPAANTRKTIVQYHETMQEIIAQKDNLKLCVKVNVGIGADCSGIVERCVEECPPGSHELKFPNTSNPETSPVPRGNLA